MIGCYGRRVSLSFGFWFGLTSHCMNGVGRTLIMLEIPPQLACLYKVFCMGFLYRYLGEGKIMSQRKGTKSRNESESFGSMNQVHSLTSPPFLNAPSTVTCLDTLQANTLAVLSSPPSPLPTRVCFLPSFFFYSSCDAWLMYRASTTLLSLSIVCRAAS